MRAHTQHDERKTGNESGVAMLLVIGFGMAMILLVATAVSVSLSGVVKAKSDQNWNGAMAAAYAGVEEYESKLANDNAYLQYGNPAAPFSATSPVDLPTGTLTNPAFGIGTAGTWATVSGSSGAASFRYEVDSSQYTTSGILRVRSTGRVGDKTRSIVANLRQQGFIDYLYFTDYEIQDPAQSGDSASCVRYGWAGRGGGCSEIAFGSGDIVSGPVHSNDTIRICDATFNGTVDTGNNPATGLFYLQENSNGNSCTGQVFNSGAPAYAPVIAMPATNTQLKQETRSDLPDDVPRPGCLYTGPTSIVFNAAGTMTIRSPWTKFTRVAGDPATSGSNDNAVCGKPGATGASDLGSTAGATIPVIDKNLIYVQSVPAGSTDPNYSLAAPTGACYSCKDATATSAGNGIGYPMATEDVSSVATSYGCRNGDAFVKGTLRGAVTVAAENFAYITGDLMYQNVNADVLGVVATNAVWIWNPVSTSGNALLPDNREIHAALLSVAHTVQVQNYNRGGSQGTLAISGAISQKFRGIVRGNGNGYTKAYNYDQRFRYIAPPKFLSPVSTTYSVSALIEVKRAFATSGVSIP